MAIQIEKITADTVEMEYFKFGKGDRTYVILPGLSIKSVMGAADVIAKHYESAADDYTIYVFDRRLNLPPVYTIEDMAKDTAAVIKALGLKDIYLFGASQGGMIAMTIAIENPALVKKMVLGSTSSHMSDAQFRMLDKWIQLAKAGDSVELYLEFGREIYNEKDFEHHHDTLVELGKSVTQEDLDRFIILAEGIAHFDVTDRLDQIQCPVLAIGVFDDAVLDCDDTMQIAVKLDARPDFRLYMYNGYGHAAFDTAPDYKERILAFFAD